MPDDRKHVRVYYSIRDDERFDTIRDDDHHLATWLRLLMAADAVWPASADLPATARKASVGALMSAGLVEALPGSRFRLHGLDAERDRRSAAPTQAARKRWENADAMRTHSERIPNASEAALLAEHSRSRAQQEQDARDPWDDPEAEAVTWLARHGCALPPNSGYHRHLVTMVESHGINAVIGMFDRLAVAGTKQGDVKGYVFGARDALDSRTRPKLADLEKDDRAEEIELSNQRRLEETQRYLAELRGERSSVDERPAAEKPPPRSRRAKGIPASTRDILTEWAAQVEGPKA